MAHAEVPRIALELDSLLGSGRVRRPSAREAMAAEAVAEPAGIAEVVELVRKCEADGVSIAPMGACRTLSQIRARPVTVGVSCAKLKKIVAYEPDDMTAVVESGISLGALNSRLARRAQHIPLDPPAPEQTTIGALIAAGQSGPLRLSEGTVRDLVIGIQFVGHGGRLARAGGRVVKNVAGYDLMKVMAGSFGTLGIITEATFKLRPVLENYSIAAAVFASHADAFGIAARIHDALPLVHLEILSRGPAERVGLDGRFALVAGFCGNTSELDYLLGRARGMWSFEIRRGAEALQMYESLRDLKLQGDTIARIAVLPSALADILRDRPYEFCAHTGCGVAEVAIAQDGIEAAAAIRELRQAARPARGHVRLIKMPAALRGEVPMFDEPAAPAMALMARLKTTFDPGRVFNPGCFVGGI